VTLRDRSDAFLTALSAGDIAGIEALREDRDTCGPGLSKAELELIVGARYLGGFYSRAHQHGYQIGETGAGLVQMGHQEPGELAA
jgi:hypothetical protein